MAFDENMAPDVQEVLDAAAVMQVTEYQVFQMAYERWFGKVAGVSDLEPYFIDYMFRERVPAWVRQFTRLVTELERAGRLEPRALGVERYAHTQEMFNRGVRYLIITVLVMVVFYILLLLTVTTLEIQAPPGP